MLVHLSASFKCSAYYLEVLSLCEKGLSMHNQVIPSSELTPFRSLVTEEVSERYRTLNITFTATLAALVFTLVSVVRFQPFFSIPDEPKFALFIISIVVLVLGTVKVIYHYFADRLIRYCVREHDVVLYKGLIFRKIVCQPILRIQHVDIHKGPIERLAGLATVQVYSAGGSAHALAIPGLPEDVAQSIRQFVLEHKDLAQHD